MDGVLAQATELVGEFVARSTYALSDGAICSALIDLHRLISLAKATAATVVHEAASRDLPHRQDATSTVAWLRDLL
ncbi:MAG TPA: hypothetical protein VH442_10735, partial [Micromonosporaceae bacterium]